MPDERDLEVHCNQYHVHQGKKNVSKINAAAGYIVIDPMSCDQISFTTDNNHNN